MLIFAYSGAENSLKKIKKNFRLLMLIFAHSGAENGLKKIKKSFRLLILILLLKLSFSILVEIINDFLGQF